jgi:hypothetical protein
VSGLPPGAATVRHWRIDEAHSNIFATWRRLGGEERDWPIDQTQWEALRGTDRLDELEKERCVDVGADGRLELAFVLPHPGISCVSVTPAAGSPLG